MQSDSILYLPPDQVLEKEGEQPDNARYWACPKHVRSQIDIRFGGDFDAAERYIRSQWRGRGDTPEWARIIRAVARRSDLN